MNNSPRQAASDHEHQGHTPNVEFSSWEKHRITPVLESLAGMDFVDNNEALKAHMTCLNEVRDKCAKELQETKKYIIDAGTSFSQQLIIIEQIKGRLVNRRDTRNIEWDLDQQMATAREMISDAYALLTPHRISPEVYSSPPFDYRTVSLQGGQSVQLKDILSYPSSYKIDTHHEEATHTLRTIEHTKKEILELYNEIVIYLNGLPYKYKTSTMHYADKMKRMVLRYPLG